MPKPKAETPRQKLIEAAHMVAADHDEVAFEKRLKKIARAKPKPKAKKPKRKRS
jgi:hypothetical protein